ncbi:MAG TPA: hypothetical protein VM935_05860 [Chitinophagaceae bacterium]|jgi:hypothetical protein|nr:hypothetical protein [Chitinophagaceae bacterium]
MKSVLLILLVCSVLQSCVSQSRSIHLYGYKQGVSAGSPSPYQTDESGKEVRSANKPRVNYFIYMSHPESMNIEPVEAWINGDVFEVRKEAVKAPVERALGSSPLEKDKVVLVPQTPGIVWMLTPVNKKDSTYRLKNKELSKNNELVIVYLLNKKLISKEVKQLKVLRTEVMQ